MQHITNPTDLTAIRSHMGGNIGFVPTMGALHEGHMSLIDAAKAACDHVIVSIFVNPKQFGEGEDFSVYPRTLQADCAMLEEYGVDVVFTPNTETLYPPSYATSVVVEGLDNCLCSAHRPGHFAGVTTVVALLFAYVKPDVAFFGEKDFQQLAILTRMNQDLPLAGTIIGVPISREADGLARSSRNRYLSKAERKIAPELYATLRAIREHAEDGDMATLLQEAAQRLLDSGFHKIDYLEVRRETDLAVSEERKGSRIFVAAHLGTTRLIDNLSFAT